MRARVYMCVFSYELPMWLIIYMLLFYVLATYMRNANDQVQDREMDAFFQNCTNTHSIDISVAYFRYITYDSYEINYDTLLRIISRFS